jgi:pilus assembly protein CpaC
VVARIRREALRKLGLNTMYGQPSWYMGDQFGSVANPGAIHPQGIGTPGAGSGIFQNVGGSASNVLTPSSTVFFGLTKNSQSLFVYLEALKQEGSAKLLANPTLVTLSGQPAEFLVGGDQPYPIAQAANQPAAVNFKPFGTRLNFVPIVLGQGRIRLDLQPEVSQIASTAATGVQVGTTVVPQFTAQRVHTTVEMETGQTFVLAGLLQTEDDARVEKVPVLGDVPLLGMAFRRVSHTQIETELLIAVTPRLVEPLMAHQQPRQFPGQESVAPTDWQLFGQGRLEVPAPQDCPGPCPPEAMEPAYPQWERPELRGEPGAMSRIGPEPLPAPSANRPLPPSAQQP